MKKKRAIPQNIKALRLDLQRLYAEGLNQEIDGDAVKNASRVAGHIISTVKHEIVYRKLHVAKRNIEFMNY